MTLGTSAVSCDLCGSDSFAEIDVAAKYTNGQPLWVCKGCGLVQVLERRSADEIAMAWDGENPDGKVYAASLPVVEARHAYVARYMTQNVPKGSLIDIGAGNGEFLEILRDRFGFEVLCGISPWLGHVEEMIRKGLTAYRSKAEDHKGACRIATILWTLENCGSCKAVMDSVYEMVHMGGHIVVATGSRILVPFKKPLSMYLGATRLDLHPWRFSARTLQALMLRTGFMITSVNRYLDTDYLVVIGRKVPKREVVQGDDWREVVDFFNRWDRDNAYYA